MKQTLSHPSSAQAERKDSMPKTAASTSSYRNAQPHRSGPLSRTQAEGPANAAEELRQASDDFQLIDEENDEPVIHSTADYLHTWNAHSRDANKENRPLPEQEQRKDGKRFLDRQANARKVQWGSQDSQESQESTAGPSKRKHAPAESDDDSQDEGFQADQRNPNLNRRVAPPAGRRISPPPFRQPSPKRVRVQEEDEAAVAARMRRQRDEANLQASARREASEEEFDDDEEEEEQPRPSAMEVSTLAKRETALAKQRTVRTQKRTAWSLEDTELLQDRIEELGCSWSAIHQAGGFETERDQVSLKDKARNMKVAFLK